MRLNREDEDPDWLLKRIGDAMLPKDCLLSTLPVENDAVMASSRFLYELTQNLPAGAILVLDDHERLAVDADIQHVLVALAEIWPADGKLIFIGRQDPPPAFARLRASRGFITIRDLDLRLNDQEAREIAQQILPKESSEAQIDAIVASASGWVAGLVLLARGAPTVTVDPHRTVEFQSVFD